MKKTTHLKNALLATVLLAGMTMPALAQKLATTGNEKTGSPAVIESATQIPDFPLPPPPFVGLEEEEKSKLLNLYPNPNNGRFTVEMEDLGGKEIVISNLIGQVVYRKTVTGLADQVEVDLQNLNTGFYFLKTDRKVIRFKKL